MTAKRLEPVHPGQMLLTDFLEPMGISQYKLSRAIGVQPIRISEIVRGKRSITADTAVRLGLFFGMSAEYWMGVQAQYDLELLEEQREELRKSITPHTAVALGVGSR